MTRVQMDDQVSQLMPSTDQKVGDVLNNLLSTLPPNRLVTQIVIDGQNIPNQKDNPVLQSGLDTVTEMNIRTVDKEIWAATGLDIAISCIERVQRSLVHASDLFRKEDKVMANQFFVHCVEGLERFYEAILITQHVLNLDFNQIEHDGICVAQIQKNFSGILANIVVLQEKQDSTSIADKIEDELLTNLCTWTAALRQLHRSRNSNA